MGRFDVPAGWLQVCPSPQPPYCRIGRGRAKTETRKSRAPTITHHQTTASVRGSSRLLGVILCLTLPHRRIQSSGFKWLSWLQCVQVSWSTADNMESSFNRSSCWLCFSILLLTRQKQITVVAAPGAGSACWLHKALWRAVCVFFCSGLRRTRQVCLSHVKCEYKPDAKIYCLCSLRKKCTRQESSVASWLFL